jgi:hypothetical protein
LQAQNEATRGNIAALFRKVDEVRDHTALQLDRVVARRPELREELERARRLGPERLPAAPPSAASRRRAREAGVFDGAVGGDAQTSVSWAGGTAGGY